jgi:hypothetical protein
MFPSVFTSSFILFCLENLCGFFGGSNKHNDIHWSTHLCHITLWDLWPAVMVMYRFIALLSSVGTSFQLVPMVGASTRINYMLPLVKYDFFASINKRVVS